MSAGNPSYQSGVQPVTRPCDSKWCLRYCGAHTCAPMSPPAVVVFRINSDGCSWEIVKTTQIATVKKLMVWETVGRRARKFWRRELHCFYVRLFGVSFAVFTEPRLEWMNTRTQRGRPVFLSASANDKARGPKSPGLSFEIDRLQIRPPPEYSAVGKGSSETEPRTVGHFRLGLRGLEHVFQANLVTFALPPLRLA